MNRVACSAFIFSNTTLNIDASTEHGAQTGFGKGLYVGEELDSSLVKAKPAKVRV